MMAKQLDVTCRKTVRRSIQEAILQILSTRENGKTCCPSEAARKVDPKGWRDLMPLTREVAKQLRSEGHLDICQRGTVVTNDTWTGPIRLRTKTLTLKGHHGSKMTSHALSKGKQSLQHTDGHTHRQISAAGNVSHISIPTQVSMSEQVDPS